jgi:8-oxo-dGTP pyrophosphatase MutT (NUDIX family)
MWSANVTPECLRQQLSCALDEAPEAVRARRLSAVPGRRPDRLEGERNGKETRFASVLLALVPDAAGNWSAVFMERTPHEGVHGGQISIPGGEVEPSDPTRLETARREFWEEMGVSVPESAVVGRLTPLYIPPSGFEVEAFVAVLDAEPSWQPDAREVAAILSLRLAPMPKLEAVRVEAGGGRMVVPGYPCQGRSIWGATAIFVTELLEVVQWAAGTE